MLRYISIITIQDHQRKKRISRNEVWTLCSMNHLFLIYHPKMEIYTTFNWKWSCVTGTESQKMRYLRYPCMRSTLNCHWLLFFCSCIIVVKLLAKSKLILAESKLKSLPYNHTDHLPTTHPQLSIKSKQVYTSPTSTYEVSLESYTQGLFI